jgi:hypothetical protein
MVKNWPLSRMVVFSKYGSFLASSRMAASVTMNQVLHRKITDPKQRKPPAPSDSMGKRRE